MDYHAQDTTRSSGQKPVINADGVEFPSCRHRQDAYALTVSHRYTLHYHHHRHHHRAPRRAAPGKEHRLHVIAYSVVGHVPTQRWPDPNGANQSTTINDMAIIPLPLRHYTLTKRQRTRLCETATTSATLSRRCSQRYPSAAGRIASPS